MTTTAMSVTNLTLLDRLRRSNPDGSIDTEIVEQLTQRNTVLEDLVVKEGNQTTGHQVTNRTALPAIGYGRINQGTAASKSKTGQFVETTGIMEGWSVVDARLARMNGDEMAFRASEDNAFLQALSNECETGIIYNSTKASPEKWMGLAPRFNVTTDPAGAQIVLADSGASGNDQSSIWLVGHGEKTVYGITPKGMESGLHMEDHSKRPWLDGSGNPFTAYVSEWQWHFGVCVEDWRYIVRVANIDTSALTPSGSTGAALIDACIRASHKLFKKQLVRPVWYCNRTVSTFLHLQSYYAVKTSTLKTSDGEGFKEVDTFLGYPLRETDAITNTESVLS